MNVYPFIEAEKAQRRNVKRACELLKVCRAAYYAARGGQPCEHDRDDAALTVLITAEHKRSRGRYGAPRIHAELRRQGRRHSRKRVARLMRQRVGRPHLRGFPRNKDSVDCDEGAFHRMATVIDIASRRVVGFALADHLRTELVADALANAVAARDPAAG